MSFRLRASTVLVASLWVAPLALAQTEHVLKEGDRAADFSITTDNGTRITPADFGGRLLVLNFWETACTPCVKELPSLRDFARRFRPQGVVVLAIRGDEDAVKYRNFLTDHRILVEPIVIGPDRSAKALGHICFWKLTSFKMAASCVRSWATSTG